MKLLFFLAIFVILIFNTHIARAVEPGDICNINQAGGQAIGKEVFFTGDITSDGMHSTMVYPEQCKNIGYSIAPEESNDSPSTIIRQAVMRVGSPGTVDKSVTIDVRATIVMLGNGKLGIKVTQLKRLVLTYMNETQS
jgi:hypothetical protein